MSNKETQAVLVTITYLGTASPVEVYLSFANYQNLVDHQYRSSNKVDLYKSHNYEGLPCIIQVGENVCAIVARKADDSE